MNGVVIHPCPVRIRPSITVVILFSVKTNPFRTSLSPHYLLARGRTISHQKKRFDGRKLNGLHFISVCSAAVVNFCVTAIHTVRKNTSFVVLVKPVFVIPSNVAVLESSRAWALLVNAVFAFKLDKRRENINWEVFLVKAGERGSHRGCSFLLIFYPSRPRRGELIIRILKMITDERRISGKNKVADNFRRLTQFRLPQEFFKVEPRQAQRPL